MRPSIRDLSVRQANELTDNVLLSKLMKYFGDDFRSSVQNDLERAVSDWTSLSDGYEVVHERMLEELKREVTTPARRRCVLVMFSEPKCGVESAK